MGAGASTNVDELKSSLDKASADELSATVGQLDAAAKAKVLAALGDAPKVTAKRACLIVIDGWGGTHHPVVSIP